MFMCNFLNFCVKAILFYQFARKEKMQRKEEEKKN